MKKTLKMGPLFAVLATMLASTVTGCSKASTADGNSNTNQKITLTVEASQAMKTGNPYKFSQENIDEFQKKYPNIKVEVLLDPDAQAANILQTKLASGEPSDIIVYNHVSAQNDLNSQKNMLDLSNEPWVSRLNNADSLKDPDGKIRGFSFSANASVQGMVYNKEIFEQLNLSIPKTYEELLKVCEAIKAKGITPIYAPFKDVWTFQIWTSAQFGSIVAKEKPGLWDEINSGKVKWTDVPEFQDILQKGLDLYTKGYMQKSALSDDNNGSPAAFSSKKYAMIIMGDWFATDMLTKDPNLKLDLFPFPALTGQDQVFSQGQVEAMYFIPNKAKHVKEAKMFLDFLSQKEQVDRAQSVKAFVPLTKDANQPKLPEFQQAIVDNYVNTGKVSTEMNAYMKVDINDLWKYYQDMIGGTKTPKDVLTAWDKKFGELMKAKGQPGF